MATVADVRGEESQHKSKRAKVGLERWGGFASTWACFPPWPGGRADGTLSLAHPQKTKNGSKKSLD